ncbi:MAG: peptidylprolyl isomerase [Bacteroidales bacterium]|nr:peptidylprolyl isomerase [Bacteroidales bacterium]
MTATLAFDPSTLGEEPVFDINTTLGTIRVKLYKETPKHRDNFVKLASEHFYDNILFHRVINGFMIQAGDPLTKDTLNADKFGTGGPGYTIPAEINPKFKHKKGALAAARRGDASNPEKESSGSQFYIVQDPKACSQLDGQYTIFGETVSGLDVIDKIAATPTDKRDRPLTDIRILSIVPVIENKPAAK